MSGPDGRHLLPNSESPLYNIRGDCQDPIRAKQRPRRDAASARLLLGCSGVLPLTATTPVESGQRFASIAGENRLSSPPAAHSSASHTGRRMHHLYTINTTIHVSIAYRIANEPPARHQSHGRDSGCSHPVPQNPALPTAFSPSAHNAGRAVGQALGWVLPGAFPLSHAKSRRLTLWPPLPIHRAFTASRATYSGGRTTTLPNETAVSPEPASGSRTRSGQL